MSEVTERQETHYLEDNEEDELEGEEDETDEDM
jgi:hypothetical protein